MAKEAKSYKFSVSHLAKKLNLEPASVRIRLRNHKVKKNEDGVYGWDSQKDFDAVVKQISAEKKTSAKKPAKKAATKKAA